MELDLDSVEQISDFVSVPAGTYLCFIAEVRERETRAGDALWAIRLVVDEGQYVGHIAAWDNLVFSSRGLNRVKIILRALGMPADGRINLSPDDLVGRRAFVDVRPSEYHSAEGRMMRRNEIPYEGYRALVHGPDEPETPAASNGAATRKPAEEDLPF